MHSADVLFFSILVIFFLSPVNTSASSTSSCLFFLSCHDLDDRFIRLTHSLLCKLSNITDRVFYTFFYKSVSAIELLSYLLLPVSSHNIRLVLNL